MVDVRWMTFEERLGAVLERTAGKVGPEIGAQLRALIEPKSLTIMAGILIAWVVSHGFAIGEVVDFIVAVVGVFSLGLAVFSGIDELYEFGRNQLVERHRILYARQCDRSGAGPHHEQVHQFLGPKLYFLRNVRVKMRTSSYAAHPCSATSKRCSRKPSPRCG